MGILDKLFGARPAAQTPPPPPKDSPVMAQVIALERIAPIVRRSDPVEENLLRLLEQVSAGKAPTETFLVAGVMNFPGETVAPIDLQVEDYNDTLFFDHFRTPYILNPDAFYTVSRKASLKRPISAMPVYLALPRRVDPVKAEKSFAQAMLDIHPEPDADIPWALPWTPPTITIDQDGVSAGFASLAKAVTAAQQDKTKTVWLAAFDAPNYPEIEQKNEGILLTILGHAQADFNRVPLARVYMPVTKRPADYPAQEEEKDIPRAVLAWQDAITQACAQAGISPQDIKTVVHDAGSASQAYGKRLALLGRVLFEMNPDLPVTSADRALNVPGVLGDLGALTASYLLQVGITAAHYRNHPVLLAGVSDDSAAHAVIILPPEAHTPPDPKREFPRARRESQAYFPWWAKRLDGKSDWP